MEVKMKKFVKFPMYIALGAAMSMSIVACSDDEPNGGGDDDGLSAMEQALQLVIYDYVDKTVIPTYCGMADATIDLYEACLAMREAYDEGTLTQEMVQTACDHWNNARRYWELSEAWLYGPAADYNIDPHIDTWPLDRTAMENLLNNTQQMEQMDDDGVFISTLGESLLGFHAVEYMIYGHYDNGLGTGVARNISESGGDAYRPYTRPELVYTAAVAADLRNQCIRLEAAWAGIDNVTSEKYEILTDLELEPTYDYGEMMRNSGSAGSLWVNYLSAVQELIVGAQDIADEVGGLKIGNPTGHGAEDDPDYIESPYSLNSINDFIDNIKSIQNAYEGYQIGVNGNVADDYIQPVDNSLSDYVATLDADLDTQVRETIQAAIDAISQMQEPFAQTARDSAYDAINQAAIDACNDVSDVLDEVLNLLSAQ